MLGGGTAGLVAATIAGRLGARVVLAERAHTGGDCLWTGCVPSKSLLAAAALAHRMRTAGAVGLTPCEPVVDFAAVMAHVHGARERIAPHDSPERLRAAGVEVHESVGRFLDPGVVEVGGRPLRYRAALIATGSRPMLPPIPGLGEGRPLTSETVWDLTELPTRLVVLGGGSIGCELAQAFGRLGSDVTVLEAGPRLVGREEPEASELVRERLEREGVRVVLDARVVGARTRSVDVEHAGGREAVDHDRLLVAAGRAPDTDGLGLARAGVETDAAGAVVVDGRLRTSAHDVYAAGDVTGALPFTHVAAYHARVAVVNALLRTRRRVSYRAVPWVTFTDPEVARVGLSEAQARERLGDAVVVARHDYAESDRAITAGEAYGFAKLVGDRRGRLLGATVAAPGGGEAIAELAARIEAGDTIADVSNAVHAYPTFAEGPAQAADGHLLERLARARPLSAAALAALRTVDRLPRPRRRMPRPTGGTL